MIYINVNDIPDKYKDSDYYIKITGIDFENNDNICIIDKFSNFDETVNNINDVIRILDLYKYWMVSNDVFYDFIINNKDIINIEDFHKKVVKFEMTESLMSLLGPIEDMYIYIVSNTNLSLLNFIINRNLIDLNQFNQHAVINLNIIKFLHLCTIKMPN
jgi:hypothetical protein